MNSSQFRLSFITNIEQIEQNLNGVFANKYNKIQYWLRNFKNFWIVQFQFEEYSFVIGQFEKIFCIWDLVSLTLKGIKATFDFSRVSKYLVSKTNTDNEW